MEKKTSFHSPDMFAIWCSPSRPNAFSSGHSPSMSNLLAGRRPRSISAAKRVARLIKSGKLVILPLDSISLTEFMSRPNFGGRRIADRRLYGRGSGVTFLISSGFVELAAANAPSMASAVTEGMVAVAAIVGTVPEELDPSR